MSNYTFRPSFKHLFDLPLKKKKNIYIYIHIVIVVKAAMPEVNQNPQRACLRNLVVGEFSTEILLENAKIKS